MMKNYRFGFEIWGLALFLIIMIPNFIWFAFPAPNDILRAESATGIIDAVASVCQVVIIAALCFVINRDRKKLAFTPMITGTVICCILYFTGWVFYYSGTVSAIIILCLTLPPCMAFLLFALDRKNMPAFIPAAVFTVCHMIYAAVNFII